MFCKIYFNPLTAKHQSLTLYKIKNIRYCENDVIFVTFFHVHKKINCGSAYNDQRIINDSYSIKYVYIYIYYICI